MTSSAITSVDPCSRCGDRVWLNCLGCEKPICDGECSVGANLTIRERRFCGEECQAKCPDYDSDNDSLNTESDKFLCEICNHHVSDSNYAGCCSDGDCPLKVEGLCQDCGQYNDKTEQWVCPKCYEADPFNDEEPCCDRCGEVFCHADNMGKGWSVPEPSPHGYAFLCTECDKLMAKTVPEGYIRALIGGKKRFMKATDDPEVKEFFQRHEDGTLGLWVGQYNTKTKSWVVLLEDL